MDARTTGSKMGRAVFLPVRKHKLQELVDSLPQNEMNRALSHLVAS
jgi:hypothetical protein